MTDPDDPTPGPTDEGAGRATRRSPALVLVLSALLLAALAWALVATFAGSGGGDLDDPEVTFAAACDHLVVVSEGIEEVPPEDPLSQVDTMHLTAAVTLSQLATVQDESLQGDADVIFDARRYQSDSPTADAEFRDLLDRAVAVCG